MLNINARSEFYEGQNAAQLSTLFMRLSLKMCANVKMPQSGSITEWQLKHMYREGKGALM